MNLNAIFLKEQIIKSVREFFTDQKFHEVISPVLGKSVPYEPNVYPFSTIWSNGGKKAVFYLATSPEGYMKKVLAQDIGNCFTIGYSFRNQEDYSPIHRPEFLMLEWYRENSNYKEIMEDTQQLIFHIYNQIMTLQSKSWSKKIPRLLRQSADSLGMTNSNKKSSHKWPVISLIQLFQKYADLDLEKIISDEEMIKAAAAKNYNIKSANWEQLFNQIFLNEIESRLGSDPFFILDFPSRISPLCAKRPDKPDFAERFEFYLDRMEIGNGNTENTDAEEVKKTFLAERKQREKSKMPLPAIDEEFLEALGKMKGKNYSGMGLGIDRLIMVLGEIKDIGEIY